METLVVKGKEEKKRCLSTSWIRSPCTPLCGLRGLVLLCSSWMVTEQESKFLLVWVGGCGDVESSSFTGVRDGRGTLLFLLRLPWVCPLLRTQARKDTAVLGKESTKEVTPKSIVHLFYRNHPTTSPTGCFDTRTEIFLDFGLESRKILLNFEVVPRESQSTRNTLFRTTIHHDHKSRLDRIVNSSTWPNVPSLETLILFTLST